MSYLWMQMAPSSEPEARRSEKPQTDMELMAEPSWLSSLLWARFTKHWELSILAKSHN